MSYIVLFYLFDFCIIRINEILPVKIAIITVYHIFQFKYPDITFVHILLIQYVILKREIRLIISSLLWATW